MRCAALVRATPAPLGLEEVNARLEALLTTLLNVRLLSPQELAELAALEGRLVELEEAQS